MKYFDYNGYPSEEFLEHLKTCKSVKQIFDELKVVWWNTDWGLIFHRPYKHQVKVELHTGGWTGNENIIAALRQNVRFWFRCYMWRKGGHFYFSFDVESLKGGGK